MSESQQAQSLKKERAMNKEILDKLSSKGFVKSINLYESVTSTNAIAKDFLYNDPISLPQLFVADEQTAGRGRMGRSWASPPGAGIWMSYLIKPDITPENIPQITLLAALSVTNAIITYGDKHALTTSPKIKWPNDIVLNGKKICGILTELVSIPCNQEAERSKLDTANYKNYVICGIGINVNTASFPDEISDKATSLLLETKTTWNREEIITETIKNLSDYICDFEKNQNLKFIQDEYNRRLISLGKEVRLINNQLENDKITGTFEEGIYVSKGIDETGALLVADTENNIRAISSGEISVRGLYTYT